MQAKQYRVMRVDGGNYSVNIAQGATVSSPYNCYGSCLLGLYIPTTFVTTMLTFSVCNTEDGTYLPVYISDSTGSSVPYSISGVIASSYISLDPVFSAVQFLKITSSATQTAPAEIVLGLVPLFNTLTNG